VLRRLREYDLFAKPEKCEFEKSSVKYLGFIISEEGVRMDPKKVEAVWDWEEPRNIKEV
jgi:hypothetical protein